MITHEQFRQKYIIPHIPIDDDHAYQYQCWDLVKRYCREVLGFECGFYGNAKNGRKNKKTFPGCEFITPGPGHDMQQGDIFIWNVNTNGHIGIVDKADGSGYTTREQNAGKGGGDGKGRNAPNVFRRYYKPYLMGFVRRIRK